MENILLNRVAFTIFGTEIYWYGVIITCAIILDFVLFSFMCKKEKLSSDTPYELLMSVVPAGILSARLFSVLFDESLTVGDYFKFREGGMSIIGGIIGGVIGILVFCAIKKKNPIYIMDLFAPLVILAQGIGRWGNFFNNEVFGKKILNENFQWFPLAVNIDGSYYMALFFYESVLNFVGFGLLIGLYFVKNRKLGLLTGVYLCYYGFIRFMLEGLRQEEYILRLGSAPISRIMSGIMFAIGLGILIYVIIQSIKEKNKNKGIVVDNGEKRV